MKNPQDNQNFKKVLPFSVVSGSLSYLCIMNSWNKIVYWYLILLLILCYYCFYISSSFLNMFFLLLHWIIMCVCRILIKITYLLNILATPRIMLCMKCNSRPIYLQNVTCCVCNWARRWIYSQPHEKSFNQLGVTRFRGNSVYIPLIGCRPRKPRRWAAANSNL